MFFFVLDVMSRSPKMDAVGSLVATKTFRNSATGASPSEYGWSVDRQRLRATKPFGVFVYKLYRTERNADGVAVLGSVNRASAAREGARLDRLCLKSQGSSLGASVQRNLWRVSRQLTFGLGTVKSDGDNAYGSATKQGPPLAGGLIAQAPPRRKRLPEQEQTELELSTRYCTQCKVRAAFWSSTWCSDCLDQFMDNDN